VFKQLRNAEKAHDAHALLHMTMKRYWSYQFAREYMQERKLTDMHGATKRVKRKRRETSPRQPKRYTRTKVDRALTKMIQDCWGLCPSVKVDKDDRRRNMARYWLDIGLPMLGLIELIQKSIL
jgi:hypothetical protein